MIALGCAGPDSIPGSDASSSSGIEVSDTAADDTPMTTMPASTTMASDESTGGVTTMAMTDDGDPTDGPSSTTTTGGPPPAPGCSVQEVTEYALEDPLPKGDGAGMFPTIVGDTLEDYCGCHTLMSNDQNLKYMFLKAPGGTLFLDYSDMTRAYGAGTLGSAIVEQVTVTHAMPPGSCYFPPDPEAVLVKWLGDGLPDGATFVYP